MGKSQRRVIGELKIHIRAEPISLYGSTVQLAGCKVEMRKRTMLLG